MLSFRGLWPCSKSFLVKLSGWICINCILFSKFPFISNNSQARLTEEQLIHFFQMVNIDKSSWEKYLLLDKENKNIGFFLVLRLSKMVLGVIIQERLWICNFRCLKCFLTFLFPFWTLLLSFWKDLSKIFCLYILDTA